MFLVKVLARDGSVDSDGKNVYRWMNWSKETTLDEAVKMVDVIEECMGNAAEKITIVDSSKEECSDRLIA